MLERVGAVLIVAGSLLSLLAIMWLILRLLVRTFSRNRALSLKSPLILFALGMLFTVVPILVNSFYVRFVDLGPLSTIVDRERHVTLTGWDQKDYSVIAPQTDIIVLQMANTDVTDETLKYLAGMKSLRELDLNHTQITDTGLSRIAALPVLQDLRLAGTKITDDGFRSHLLKKESLMNLELTNTSVSSKTVREWKAAKPDRKALK